MFTSRKTNSEDFQMDNNTTSIEINYNSSNLPLWAKKELQNQYGDNVNENDIIKIKNSQNQSNLVLQEQNKPKNNKPWFMQNNKNKLNHLEANNFLDRNIDENDTILYEPQIERIKRRNQSVNNQSNKDQEDNIKKKNPLYISSENLTLNDAYLNKSSLNKFNFSAKPILSLKPAVLLNNSNKVIQQNQKSLINNNKPPISKRREELTRALTEARLKLQTLEINRNKSNGLSTSMSVANINRLPLNVQRDTNNSKQPLKVNINEQNQEKVRRSISLSDLSKQNFTNKNLALKVQLRNKQINSPNVYYPIRNFRKSSVDTSVLNNDGLLSTIDQMNSSGTILNKPIKVKMSRSSSMASINKNDMLGRTLDGYGKPQGLWTSPSSLSINTLRNNTVTLTSNNYSTKYTLNNRSLRKSSDDDSSSDENDLYHRFSQRPSTPPKPNIFRQLRRSSTTSNNFFMSNNNSNLSTMTMQENTKHENLKSVNRKNWNNNFELRPAKSEYNLNSMGQDNLNSSSSGFWSNNSNGTIINGKVNTNKSFNLNHNNIGYDNFDLSVINPATIPLSFELFQHIVDELNHLATFAKKVHYRAITENNRKLCELLAEGISKAYVNLNTIVSSSDISNNYVLPKSNVNNFKSNQSFVNLSDQDCDHDEDNSLGKNNLSNNINSVVNSISLTSDSASSSMPQESIAMNLLQTYSERLLSMVEQHYNKNTEKK